jgi:hypothetical protein
MQHSVKFIGKTHEEISLMRKDSPSFSAVDFFQFAKDNESKYHTIESGDDLLVSTWYSGDLIDDYRKTLKNK